MNNHFVKQFSRMFKFTLYLSTINLVFGLPNLVTEHVDESLNEASVSNDHHGGTSIVGLGGSHNKGITFDLTKGTDSGGHKGLFGGSFISHDKLSSGIKVGDSEDHDYYHSSSQEGLGSYSSPITSYDAADTPAGDYGAEIDTEIIAGLTSAHHKPHSHGSSYSSVETYHDSHLALHSQK